MSNKIELNSLPHEQAQAGEGGLNTGDSRLAAALMAMGFLPAEKICKIALPGRPGDWLQWSFKPVSECGKYRAQELVAAWRRSHEFIAENPEHPFAYVMAAMLNHLWIIDQIKGAEQHVLIRKGRSICLIAENAPLATEAALLGRCHR